MVARDVVEHETDGEEIGPDEYREGFGENLQETLDLNTWRSGEDLATIYSRIEAEVREAVFSEREFRQTIRDAIFPQLSTYPGAPRGAGVYAADPDDISRVHRGLLFNGGTEACDARLLAHDSLPLTIFQIGVSLVSYQGNQGTWTHRLFRRDLRVTGADPLQELERLLEQRSRRDGLNQSGQRDNLARLARRGIMAYAERAILLHRSEATWRMGHGSPAPLELITGSGSVDLMIEASRILRDLMANYQKFVFVASEPNDRFMLTVGDALRPLEYAIIRPFDEIVGPMIREARFPSDRVHVDTSWAGESLSPFQWMRRFVEEVASQVVVGVYRATRLAPPQLFYAHQDHADIAAHVAIADSVLQEHRGFPMLIDLADNVCRGVFGQDVLRGPITTAYADAGAPFRYMSERQSRYGV